LSSRGQPGDSSAPFRGTFNNGLVPTSTISPLILILVVRES
jgi:hypothetical protein